LVYTSGVTENKIPIKDEEFNVEVENSIKIRRNVEMYQWVQTVHR
jgi:predicted aspartyl protease